MFHAELDQNNVVVAVSDLTLDESSQPHMILINSLDISLLGKRYDPTTSTFSDAPLTLSLVKLNKIRELTSIYNSSFITFTSSALGVIKTYPINQEAQDDLERLERRLIADPNKSVFSFYTIEDKTLVDHTRAQFLLLLEDAELFEKQQHRKLEDLRNQINASTTDTIDKVNAIVWS